MAHKITALGNVRIFDKKSGKLIAEGELNEIVMQDSNRQWWRIKRVPKKICPHCGKEL